MHFDWISAGKIRVESEGRIWSAEETLSEGVRVRERVRPPGCGCARRAPRPSRWRTELATPEHPLDQPGVVHALDLSCEDAALRQRGRGEEAPRVSFFQQCGGRPEPLIDLGCCFTRPACVCDERKSPRHGTEPAAEEHSTAVGG